VTGAAQALRVQHRDELAAARDQRLEVEVMGGLLRPAGHANRHVVPNPFGMVN
jgi:hypothetical protein